MRTNYLIMLAASILVYGGCGQPTDQPGRVAVIDLDKISEQLGSKAQIVSAIKQRETNLNQQLANAKASYEKQLRAALANFGTEPSQEQQQQLSNLKQQANKQLQQVAQQAKGNLDQHRAELLQQFRSEAKQAARQVAFEQDLSMVVIQNDTILLVHDEAVDITSEVANRMQDEQAIQK